MQQRRKLRRWAPGFTIATLLALVACGDGERGATDSTSTSAPASTTTTAATGFPGIWPFTSQAEVDAYASGPDRTYRDPENTARLFIVRYMGMKSPAVFPFRPTDEGGEVGVGPRLGEGGRPLPGPRATTFVVLRQTGTKGPSGPWVVVGARTPTIELASPEPLSSISPPVTLVGRANAFEGTVAVQVKEDGMEAGRSLGDGFVTGSGSADGQLGPFQGEISFRRASKTGGAIVLLDESEAEGGDVLRATVVRVLFAQGSL